MERILVYGVRKETKEIYTAYLAPEKLSKQEVHDKLFEANANNSDLFYYYMAIDESLADVISFLKNNRTLDIERILKPYKT